MQLIFVTNVNLDENENVVIFVIWKVVQGPLDTMWHLFNLIYDYKF